MASKSLGTLTLDLIAQVGGFVAGMDKAERSSLKWRKEVEKNAKAAGVAIGAGMAAGVTALTAITLQSIRAAGEISNLSSVANASTAEFQKYAAGAKLVGIEQDKLADIFKDVNDKVGDFLNTGGGALADFFTNIAPKVGVAADDFRNLSGPQALGLYVQSLEKANVSQADMTFYMEAIASDATALLPLLRDNSKGFNTLGDAAAAAGAVMDEETIRAANEVGAAIWLIEQNAVGLKNQVSKGLLPVLAKFAENLSDTAVNGALSKLVADDLAASFSALAKFATGAVAGVHLLGIGLKTLSDLDNSSLKGANWWEKYLPPARVYRAYQNFDDIKKTLEDAGVKFDATAQGYATLMNSFDAPMSSEPGNKISDLATMLQKLREQMGRPGTFTARTKEEQAAQKAAEQAAKALQNQFAQAETGYERQIALINTEVDKRKDATEVAKLQFEIESGKLKGINAQQQERLNTLAAELDRLKKIKQANEDAAKAAAFREALSQSNFTAREGFELELAGLGMGEEARQRLREDLQIRQDFNRQMSDLQKQYNSGEISKDLYDTETKALHDALEERLQIQRNYYEQIDEAQENWMDGVNEAFQNYVDSASDYSQQAADAVTGVLGDATSNLSDGIYDLITGTESLSDSLTNVSVAIGQSIIKAMADMAAQWLVLQAVQLTSTKATQASAAAALSANAQATALQAGIAAFASTAAIPIVGPAAAPAAMAAAIAATTPMAAAVSALATAGSVGFEKGGYTGNGGIHDVAGLVHGQEFVFDAAATARLGVGNLEAIRSGKIDATLSRVQAGMAAGGGRRGGGDTFNLTLPNARTAKEGAEAGAAFKRAIARNVAASGRYA